ncbi:LytTR family DNA-binding domain-containing protein [Aureispira sp. CCB-E]|uniref:LytR/AlgR family response regulator transcription factor n=1 Tax=Aureispira sp. CCB-E TaxID=3051121 RepID=UPI002868B705|nr:LytTR family DNA-binding domain-containing protein [Aureispira sp. CCB-E]WMX13115.1 LytTR family DNA-binding domain-containing protein [Aureispira sp. CCB-E]
MNVIIIEDEKPAFNKLSKYLLEHRADAQVLEWFDSVDDALKGKELFAQCDLLLSDIQLLDGNCFQLFQQLKINCPIIFCTAYNKYMENAFETNGIAYLIKPYSQEAFNNAMQKYEHFFEQKNTIQTNKDTIHLIEKMFQHNNKSYKQRFSIKKKNGIIIKKVSEAYYFQASGDFCILVDVNGEKHIVNYKISVLENLLDPQLFFRINRSEIVNIEYILKIEPHFKNKMQILLPKGIELYTSGARTPEFRRWLEGE